MRPENHLERAGSDLRRAVAAMSAATFRAPAQRRRAVLAFAAGTAAVLALIAVPLYLMRAPGPLDSPIGAVPTSSTTSTSEEHASSTTEEHTTKSSTTTIPGLPGSIEWSPDSSLVLGPDGLSDTLTFGSDGNEVVAALSATFGPPARDHVEELLLLSSPHGDNIYGDAADGLGILSEYPFYRSVCWDDVGLCIEMDSDDGVEWIFVTWRYLGPQDASEPLFTAEGIGVGSTFREMRAAYPEVSVDWGEGDSTGFTLPGWDPAFNGALVGNGMFDFNLNPIAAFGREELLSDDIPDSVTVRSLYVGEGVDYGCC